MEYAVWATGRGCASLPTTDVDLRLRYSLDSLHCTALLCTEYDCHCKLL
jgi:hypothetical protein